MAVPVKIMYMVRIQKKECSNIIPSNLGMVQKLGGVFMMLPRDISGDVSAPDWFLAAQPEGRGRKPGVSCSTSSTSDYRGI